MNRSRFHRIATVPVLATLLIFFGSGITTVFCQSASFPYPFVSGAAPCETLVVAATSRNWRVRTGDVFEVSAVHPTQENGELKYQWTVSNGKIIAGNGSRRIRVKAGAARTAGYANLSGFVSVKLDVERVDGAQRCSVSTGYQVVIGPHREQNGAADVEDLILDEETVVHPCAPGQQAESGKRVSDDSMISVSTLSKDAENDVLVFHYRVTGGKIIGSGKDVVWDLTSLSPGTYQIWVGADDGYGVVGKTAAKTITVLDCPVSCRLVLCPTIEILKSVAAVEPGEVVAFTGHVSGGLQESVGYRWTVDGGDIIDGQDTPSITVLVATGKLNLTLTLSIVSDPPLENFGCTNKVVTNYWHSHR